MKQSYTVVIADDHEIVRDGLRGLLARMSGLAFEVVGEAANGLETVSLVKRYRPDLLLLDVTMPLAVARRYCSMFGAGRLTPRS